MKQFYHLTLFLSLSIFSLNSSFAQTKSNIKSLVDSLPEVRLQSFNYNKTWQEIPASVALLDTNKLYQISNSSLLPAMNTIPGV